MSTSKSNEIPNSIRWTEGSILSLRLRNGQYSWLQMTDNKGTFAILDIFSECNNPENIDFDSIDILFVCWTVKTFRRLSELKISGIKSQRNINLPKWFISPGRGFSKAVFWPGTSAEIECLKNGKGENTLRRSYRENGKIHEEVIEIDNNDYKRYEDFELTTLRDYPELNERLLLCSEMEVNFDPLKEIAFGRDLPEMCLDYIKIISGKYRISELGY